MVVKTQSITKASEKLHLTQPAVSIQLKNLQSQFEIPLTELIGRRIYITDFGKEIAEAAEEIINQVNVINNKELTYQGQLSGRLKISVVSTGKYVMPFFLSDFLRANSGVKLSMEVTNKNEVIESLAKNEVDFALVSILPSGLSIEKLDLLENKLYLVGNNKTNYSKRKLSKDIFKELALIYREPGSGTRQSMERFIERNKISVIKKMELTSNEAVKQAVLAGLGYSIMPLIGIKNELINKDLQIIPVKGLPIMSTWSLIWLKGKGCTPVLEALLNFLKKEKKAIINEKFSWYQNY